MHATQGTTSTAMVLLRVGTGGRVGRFLPSEPLAVRRGERVVCRTQRGLEVGQVLGPSEAVAGHQDASDGRLLRRMAPEDELLWGHLQQLGEQAFASCQQWLREAGVSSVLLEVEPLLDGRTLYFHFLADVEPQLQEQLDELAAIYEKKVRESKFAQLVEHGCGPGCGTAEAKNGCGTQRGCAVCKIAGACSSRPKTS
ncbi:MAG: hypothetical protein KDA45_06145 [Planctomycetales bacterium]|nr:hypothetical protein [Planctomycetales bacterium]